MRIFTLFLIVIAFSRISQVRFNYTPSMPVGFYIGNIYTNIHPQDIVAVCLPLSINVYGLKRSYLLHGHCPGGAISVLKTVIAVPGDTIQLTNQAILVNGIYYFAPYQAIDHAGRHTKKFVLNGTYHSTGYWLYGSNDFIHSWDSRYYGPVSRENIIGVYRPLITF